MRRGGEARTWTLGRNDAKSQALTDTPLAVELSHGQGGQLHLSRPPFTSQLRGLPGSVVLGATGNQETRVPYTIGVGESDTLIAAVTWALLACANFCSSSLAGCRGVALVTLHAVII